MYLEDVNEEFEKNKDGLLVVRYGMSYFLVYPILCLTK